MRAPALPSRAAEAAPLRRPVADRLARLVLGLILFVAVFPVLWTLLNAFKRGTDIVTYPPKLFFTPVLDNFATVFAQGLATPLLNTLIVTTASVALSVVVGSLAGYALARFQGGLFKGMGLLVFSMRFLPTIVIILPIFLLFRDLHLVGTHLGLTLAYQLFALPFTIWITWGFFAQIPEELEQAASIDGCNRLQAFSYVTLPLAMPGIGAAALVNTIFCWNQFLIPFILGGSDARVITTEIARYSGAEDAVAQWGPLAALAVVIAAPVLLIGLALNRYLLRGLLGRAG